MSLTLKDRILEKDAQYKGKPHVLGMTGLTNPAYINSSRSIMFTSHLTQMVDLINPESPKVFTNMENIVGKNSTGYLKAKSNYKIIHKIPKFGIGEFYDKMYVLIVYDTDKERYDIITKKVVEDLTEKFGYVYNTDKMDSFKVGDNIKKNTVLYKSLSYDDDMNYRYGVNVRCLYCEDPYTIEDAIVCSTSFTEKMACKEVETIRVSLNDNDIFCNIYGDDENYKGFPDIGEYIQGKILCAKRRIHNNQLLFDLKKDNLKKINFSSDKVMYSSGRIVDMNIYSNKQIEDIPDNIFNKQISRYLEMQMYFYQKIHDACKDIVDSGKDYSRNISWWYNKARDILDPNTLWKEENYSVFSNMVLEFVVERNSPLTIGQKITGRQGNKGVISKILPDSEMPFDESGKPVDIMVNALGVVGRLNPMQIFEQSINHITNAVKKKLKELKSDKDRETLLFDIIGRFNKSQEKDLRAYYNKLKKKSEFWEDIYNDHIYIHMIPLWEERPLYDIIVDIYSDYEWIKPTKMFVNRFGRKIEIMKPLIVSEIYMMRLKQDSKKGFSARSTGALNRRGIPDKSNKSKRHEDLYSTTPIRMGDQEGMGMMIGMDPQTVADLHLYYRSDARFRAHVIHKLIENPTEPLKLNKTLKAYNKNAAELEAYLKTMGYEQLDSDMLRIAYDDVIRGEQIGDYYYLGYDSQLDEAKAKHKIKSDAIGFIGSQEEFDEYIETEYQKLKDAEKQKYHQIKLVNEVDGE